MRNLKIVPLDKSFHVPTDRDEVNILHGLLIEKYRSVKQEFEDEITRIITDSLFLMGTEFYSEKEFLKFCKERLTVVTREGHEIKEIWLDFSEDSRDIRNLILRYTEPRHVFDAEDLTHKYKFDIYV